MTFFLPLKIKVIIKFSKFSRKPDCSIQPGALEEVGKILPVGSFSIGTDGRKSHFIQRHLSVQCSTSLSREFGHLEKSTVANHRDGLVRNCL